MKKVLSILFSIISMAAFSQSATGDFVEINGRLGNNHAAIHYPWVVSVDDTTIRAQADSYAFFTLKIPKEKYSEKCSLWSMHRAFRRKSLP